MYVGDGTWTSEKNSFLLPNLVGLNFATMRYNGRRRHDTPINLGNWLTFICTGMGNRFFTMTGYHALVRAHGILAAITFLGLVPAAIMLARFYGRSPFWALRLHIWLQVLTFLLTTVLFILGFFAVGPTRSLTNPHHGIGVAIYVLIILQVFGGWMVHKKEYKKRRLHIPMKVMLHHWFGRIIALLGLIQIPLGLTLYGSPKELFILYTLAAFALVLVYFILSWMHQRRLGRDYDGSSYSGHDEVVHDRKDHRSGLGKIAVAGLGAVGLAALFRRNSSKRRHEDSVVGTESRTSYSTNEKHSHRGKSDWKSKLLTIGVVAGSIAAIRSLFGGHRDDDSSDGGPYRPHLGGNHSAVSESFIEEGRSHRPVTPTGASPGYVRPSHPLSQPPITPHHHRSTSSFSDSYVSGSPSRRDRRGAFRTAAATGGALFAVKSLFKTRRQRKEDRRIEDERHRRASSHGKYTGDGFPKRHRPHRVGSQSSTDMSASVVNPSHPRLDGQGAGPILGGVGAASAAALADRNRIRPPGTDPPVVAGPSTLPIDIPPIPPTHRSDIDSSGSEMYTTGSGHRHHRHHLTEAAAAGAINAASGSRRRRSGQTQNTDSMESPPVSLKVKMHNDGRHVTLRRLTEEEAAAQREERRRAKRASVPPTGSAAGGAAGIANSSRRRRASSLSSSSGGEGTAGRLPNAERRWRRTEALERRQAEAAAAGVLPPQTQNPTIPPPSSGAPAYQTPQIPVPTAAYPQGLAPPPGPAVAPLQQQIPPPQPRPQNLPSPPPIPTGPSHTSFGGLGSVTSPGTETSGATEYANNRRRRRAERAQAQARLAAKEGRSNQGGRPGYGAQGVEFT